MNTVGEFWAAVSVAERDPVMTDPHLLGSRLAWAASRVLGGQGAGLSVSSRDLLVRIPLGSSSPAAAAAERLQFTAGEGPCLDAFAVQDAIMASAPVISRTWPIFAGQLRVHTPFRSVFAAPLPGVGALDLYFDHPAGCGTVDVVDAFVVAQQILVALVDADVPAALERSAPSTAEGRRAQVSVAMGILIAALALTAEEALALLRAHSFIADRSVDDFAADVLTGAILPEQLMA